MLEKGFLAQRHVLLQNLTHFRWTNQGLGSLLVAASEGGGGVYAVAGCCRG